MLTSKAGGDILVRGEGRLEVNTFFPQGLKLIKIIINKNKIIIKQK